MGLRSGSSLVESALQRMVFHEISLWDYMILLKEALSYKDIVSSAPKKGYRKICWVSVIQNGVLVTSSLLWDI